MKDKLAISTNTKPTWKIIDLKGNIVETFRCKQTARERIRFLKKVYLQELNIVHV